MNIISQIGSQFIWNFSQKVWINLIDQDSGTKVRDRLAISVKVATVAAVGTPELHHHGRWHACQMTRSYASLHRSIGLDIHACFSRDSVRWTRQRLRRSITIMTGVNQDTARNLTTIMTSNFHRVASPGRLRLRGWLTSTRRRLRSSPSSFTGSSPQCISSFCREPLVLSQFCNRVQHHTNSEDSRVNMSSRSSLWL